jgi:hypothetical protein
MKPATIPKSLHTVTVICAMARAMHAMHAAQYKDTAATPGLYVGTALRALGYDNVPDAYGLATKAAAQLRKEAPRAMQVAA